MSVKVDWYLTNHIMFIRFGETMTMADVRDFSSKAIALLDEAETPGDIKVNIIVDESRLYKMPGKVWEIARNMPALTHEKIGWVVFCNPDRKSPVAFVTDLLTRLIPGRYRRVDTIDEALDFVQKIDPYIIQIS